MGTQPASVSLGSPTAVCLTGAAAAHAVLAGPQAQREADEEDDGAEGGGSPRPPAWAAERGGADVEVCHAEEASQLLQVLASHHPAVEAMLHNRQVSWQPGDPSPCLACRTSDRLLPATTLALPMRLSPPLATSRCQPSALQHRDGQFMACLTCPHALTSGAGAYSPPGALLLHLVTAKPRRPAGSAAPSWRGPMEVCQSPPLVCNWQRSKGMRWLGVMGPSNGRAAHRYWERGKGARPAPPHPWFRWLCLGVDDPLCHMYLAPMHQDDREPR